MFFTNLEKIMYDRLYKFPTDNNMLYKKKFGHSTEHAITQLGDQVKNSFGSNLYTLGFQIIKLR